MFRAEQVLNRLAVPVPSRITTISVSPSAGKIRPLAEVLRGAMPSVSDGSYLVDSASSHMLVSKIKPCMSKYKHSYCETANGSLNQLSFI